MGMGYAFPQSIKKMLNFEEINKIIKIEGGYQIVFNNHNAIRIKNKKSILPLLFLIKYGESSNEDFFNERYKEVVEFIKDKTDVDICRNDYENINRPYSDLITEEGFIFIIRRIKGHRAYYRLYKKDHSKLYDIKREATKENENLKRTIYHKQYCTCNMCHLPLDYKDLYIDLIVPIFRGGKEDVTNYQLICEDCINKKKKMCKECIELCSNATCPLNNIKVKAMNIQKIAMKKTK